MTKTPSHLTGFQSNETTAADGATTTAVRNATMPNHKHAATLHTTAADVAKQSKHAAEQNRRHVDPEHADPDHANHPEHAAAVEHNKSVDAAIIYHDTEMRRHHHRAAWHVARSRELASQQHFTPTEPNGGIAKR